METHRFSFCIIVCLILLSIIGQSLASKISEIIVRTSENLQTYADADALLQRCADLGIRDISLLMKQVNYIIIHRYL
jgi:hypothetical protein